MVRLAPVTAAKSRLTASLKRTPSLVVRILFRQQVAGDTERFESYPNYPDGLILKEAMFPGFLVRHRTKQAASNDPPSEIPHSAGRRPLR